MPRALAILLALLGAGVLASERFKLSLGRPPASWLRQLSAPSLVACTARCRQEQDCGTVAWAREEGCRLAEGGSDSTTGNGAEITLYHHVTDPSLDASPAPTTEDGAEDESETATTAAQWTSTTVSPTTATPSVVSCPTDFTHVDGHCYQHKLASPSVNFDAARALCASLASGGELAGLYSQADLDFFTLHSDRPDAQQWIGMKVSMSDNYEFRNLLDNSRPDIPNFTDLLEGRRMNIQLSLPAGLATGKLLRTAASTRLSAVVCEAPAQ